MPANVNDVSGLMICWPPTKAVSYLPKPSLKPVSSSLMAKAASNPWLTRQGSRYRLSSPALPRALFTSGRLSQLVSSSLATQAAKDRSFWVSLKTGMAPSSVWVASTVSGSFSESASGQWNRWLSP